MDHSDYLYSFSHFSSHPAPGPAENDAWENADNTFDATDFSHSLQNDSTLDMNQVNDMYYLSSESANDEWLSWLNANVPETPQLFPFPARQDPGVLPAATSTKTEDIRSEMQTQNATIASQSLSNVTQWLDGAYCPPQPCSYCRKHRLQCLIIRTTPANPNPVSSCSSCVALFRECSLARGEKRQPSRFETLSPVMGHLHGVTELEEDGGDQAETLIPVINCADKQKESKQFVRRGVRILKEWFHDHHDFPYPSEDEKVRLVRETGFSRKRLSTWFANARRRQKERFETPPAAQICRSGSPMPASRLTLMTPMERWQNSPPEDEAVPESVIRNAISSSEVASASEHEAAVFGSFLSLEETSSHLGSSVSSMGSRHSESSTGSIPSAWSHPSGESSLPFPLHHPRPRTRRRTRPRTSMNEGQYQCTFCTQSFKKKHDWLRHERSVHLQLDSWICTPDVNELRPGNLPSECRFCNHGPPSIDHWNDHEFEICAQKPVADRSFSRKDYLWQHLRKFHGCTKIPIENLDQWRSAGSAVRSRCGFCNASLPTWTARGDHLADHFKQGYRMHQWVGDWGLDPYMLGALQNAILPFERTIKATAEDFDPVR
ncbi:homeobox domain-containing protein [Aspergillus thermomutatus]|uniref:Homeobox domain-containing protein n=1 Tax=Aspergillus thermomutatus TaxID=41047 RepID=A0A397GV98_ASPTH|nr:uncharacterized protein CDV56_104741 [Aspergillus thermomutatus]RHZ52993.1 hypothetical protein CDV56_104741 [Aspergillus thermomutatus]